MALLKPGLFEKMGSFKDYLKLIEKDVRNLAPKDKNHDFVLVTGVPFGGAKKDVFLLTSESDKEWETVLEDLKKRGKKLASGECRIGQVGENVKIAVKSCSGGLTVDAAVASIGTEVFDPKSGISATTFKEFIVEGSHAKAGSEFTLDSETKKKLLKVNLEVEEYGKFAKTFEAFCKRYNLTNYHKVPVEIWSSLLLGIMKSGELNDLIPKVKEVYGGDRPDADRMLLAYQGPEGKPLRHKMLQQAMDGLSKFVQHAARYLDAVVEEVKKAGGKSTWCFWSGTGAQDLAKELNPTGIVLEGTVGSWFDKVWNFQPMTGVSNFQLWTSLSEMYAQKAAENYANFSFQGYVGPGATIEQNVFNQIESPTFLEVLDSKKVVNPPSITWFVVQCTKDDKGRWQLDRSSNKGVAAEFSDRGAALKKVTELYG